MSRAEAEHLVWAMRELDRRGLNRGATGNASLRSGGDFLVTPSGVAPSLLGCGSMVRLSPDGEVLAGGQPSSEWRFHAAIYRERSDAGAVVHVHSTWATALACQRRALPAFHYMVAVAGGADIRCADYATFGTEALSEAVLAALDGRRACLMANHGMVALGADLSAAVDLAVEVEALAQQYLAASMSGEPRLLDEREMSTVRE
ncbi:MAG: class II aldolase/adducin family protein, partial [Gammaproteobacteria bacterium]